MSAPPIEEIPPCFGRYETICKIASGGAGTVYLCRVAARDDFRRLFAVKMLHLELSGDEEFQRMLSREVRLGSRLTHPNIVGISDVGTNEFGRTYLVMDYVDGGTLSELLAQHTQERPFHLIMPIMIDALRGLHAAHTLVDDMGEPVGLIHRDFSPQNVLVGADGIARLSDFGVAKAALGWDPTRSTVTKGKPAYMSPEQVMGADLDHRSDIFAAGVVLWNALTGEKLFSGPNAYRTMMDVMEREVPPPSQVGLRPPEYYDEICFKSLQRDPADRYQSAQEMIDAIREAAAPHNGLAPTRDVAQWTRRTFSVRIERRRAMLRQLEEAPRTLPYEGSAPLGQPLGPHTPMSARHAPIPVSGPHVPLSEGHTPAPVAAAGPSAELLGAVPGFTPSAGYPPIERTDVEIDPLASGDRSAPHPAGATQPYGKVSTSRLPVTAIAAAVVLLLGLTGVGVWMAAGREDSSGVQAQEPTSAGSVASPTKPAAPRPAAGSQPAAPQPVSVQPAAVPAQPVPAAPSVAAPPPSDVAVVAKPETTTPQATPLAQPGEEAPPAETRPAKRKRTRSRRSNRRAKPAPVESPPVKPAPQRKPVPVPKLEPLDTDLKPLGPV